MRGLVGVAGPLAVVAVLVVAASGATASAAEQGKRWVCPPCGQPCDEAVFDKPGSCPKCGMALVEQASAQAVRAAQRKAAVLVFNGVEIIDYSGPYEMFGAAGFDVYTVGETRDPVVTAMGLTVVPKFTFADAPPPDVLVVPGGSVRAARDSAATLKYVAETSARATHTLSVCNGAFILASAGLLEGLSATTTAGNLDRLQKEYPKVKVVRDRRFVDNGRIVTAGGLTAGIDGALHVLARMLGDGHAQEVALQEEYDWRPGSEFARATLADLLIPDFEMAGLGSWDIVRTEGGTDRWEIEMRGTSDLGAAELVARVGRLLTAADPKWTQVAAPAAAASTGAASDWKIADREGRPWTGRLTVRPAGGAPHAYDALLAVARAGAATR